MQYTGKVKAEFDAGHRIEGHPRCGRQHGHHYRVAATTTGHMTREGFPVDMAEMHEALTAITDELDCRYLEEMMPGVPTTPHGIAGYIMERLLANWPGIQSVTVWERPCCSATVTREAT